MRTQCVQDSQASRQSSRHSTASNRLETASRIPRTKLHIVQDCSCVTLYNVQCEGMETITVAEVKTYRVEARTQHTTYRRENQWHTFRTVTARSKADAIARARRQARNGDCYAGLGLVWWRAVEEAA